MSGVAWTLVSGQGGRRRQHRLSPFRRYAVAHQSWLDADPCIDAEGVRPSSRVRLNKSGEIAEMSRKPKTNARAARRLSSKGATGPVQDIDGLLARLPKVTKGVTGSEVTRAEGVLSAGFYAAKADGQGLRAVVADIASGRAAFRAAAFDHASHTTRADSPLAEAACRTGCAFCCILPGKDGGVVTEHEAQALHKALSAHAGQPDGRDWHAQACPALDPESLSCRAYEARPIICRSYFSKDAQACEDVAEGKPGKGTAVLGAYPLYLAIIALVRGLLGVPKAPTYALKQVAAAAVAGEPLETALKQAKHAPSVLKGELSRTSLPGR